MNTRSFTTSILAVAAAAFTAQAQIPEGSLLSVAPTTPGNMRVQLANPGNHTWVLQSSTDLTNWTNVETLKVYNGRFGRSRPAAAGTYYRMHYDSNAQTMVNTTAAALLLPVTPFNYANQPLPPHLLAPPIVAQNNTPIGNPITDAGAKLGRTLFWDKRLSINQTVSCASCHDPAKGFTDGRKFSLGFDGRETGRNSMGLTSARYYQRGSFFWDERAATLEDQVLQPIQNSVEMGMTLPALVTRLAAEPYYQDLFTQAFGSPTVNNTRISQALAQFVRSIISTQTKYDQGVPVNFSNFTVAENRGRQLFNANCVQCHGSDNFVPGPGNPTNNGLENPYVDKGIGAITNLPQDEGRFKVPTLRNIELTAPYMHDGRFTTLEEVVEFYNSGVVAHPNLSPPLRLPGPGPVQARRLNLNATDKAALVAFMKTLTDTTVTSDPKFSDPFNYGN